MKKILFSICSLLLIFLMGCEPIVLTQDPKNPKETNNSNNEIIIEDKTNLEIPPSNQNQEKTGNEYNGEGQAAIPPEFPSNNPNSGSIVEEITPWFIDCINSTNKDIQQDIFITLAEIKDPISYEFRKKEAINLINQCYSVNITEEYEIEAGNISTVIGSFNSKIIDTDSIFQVIPFYPIMDLYDYDGFIGTQIIKYISSSTPTDIFNYYQNIEPAGYKYIDFIQDQKLVYNNEIENKTITINITLQGNYSLISFDLLQQFDVE